MSPLKCQVVDSAYSNPNTPKGYPPTILIFQAPTLSLALFAAMRVHSPAKINLVLEVARKRPDGFHELETLFHSAPIFDTLEFQPGSQGISLRCSDPKIPNNRDNLVYRAAEKFFNAAQIEPAIEISLEKHIPSQAGLGGGSGNAAITLSALNQLNGQPLRRETLTQLASELGSDVPFFLENAPALATGRGENLQILDPFPNFKNLWFLIAKLEFGVPTGWAYQSLRQFPETMGSHPGLAQEVADQLAKGQWPGPETFFNSFEAPVFHKFPILRTIKSSLLENNARAAALSGSGSAMYGLFENESGAKTAESDLKRLCGPNIWTAVNQA